MRKAIISRMTTGHWLATFANDGAVYRTQVVGGPNDKAIVAAKHVASNFGVDQVGIRAKDIGPACVATYGKTVWLKPGWR